MRIRGLAIGRRNYMFAGADSGGERAVAIYSLIGTGKLNGVAPEAWLRNVLTRIAHYPVNSVTAACLQPTGMTPLPSGVMTSSITLPEHSKLL